MIRTALLALLVLLPVATAAMDFSSWKEQRFSLFSGNSYQKKSNEVVLRSDGTVSLIWSPVPAEIQQATTASWHWNVTTSVPATDLSRKGGDDRNIALYFVFAPGKDISKAQNTNIKHLMSAPSTRVLMYVFGGAHQRGDILPSPYLKGLGKTVVLRPAGTGSFTETVDLARDYYKAFGQTKPPLAGLAISADSDDTGGTVVARLSDLVID